jgi:hypothetical protein
MTVSSLENNMSYKELLEWHEYSQLEPFLSERVEIMMAKHMQLFANVNRNSKTEPFDIEDFMLTVKKEKKEKTLANQVIEAMAKITKG